jgi:uncharacterized UPF0160 family protein
MSEPKKVKIVTHSSGFHTDDVFAVATLLLVLKGSEVEVIRSRDQAVIDSGDYVVDVGGIHDPSKNRFDHHQSGGAGKRENGIPYASFGLVWNAFGSKLTENKEVADRIDFSIVQPIDSNDNGVQFVESTILGLRPVDVGFITSLFGPTWKEDGNIDETFMELVSYAKHFLIRIIKSFRDKVEAEKLVLENYENSEDKRVIILGNSKFPWEEVLSKFPEPLFVIYKNINADNWSIKAIRNDLFSYIPRKKLPEAWAGKMGEELEKITGIPGSVFCHNARFMAVAKTKEGVLKMAEIALN